MMRVDAWTHFIPKGFSDRMAQLAGNVADIGKRMREVPCLHDLDERMRIVDMFPEYAQILSHGMPPIENVVQGAQTEELCKLLNDGFVEICAKHKDHFPGWVAQVSLGYPEGAVREGVIRHFGIRRDGTPRDTVMYSVLANEWPEVRRHLELRLRRHSPDLSAAST